MTCQTMRWLRSFLAGADCRLAVDSDKPSNSPTSSPVEKMMSKVAGCSYGINCKSHICTGLENAQRPGGKGGCWMKETVAEWLLEVS